MTFALPKTLATIAFASAALLATGCSNLMSTAADAPAAKSMATEVAAQATAQAKDAMAQQSLYEVHHDNRIYLFDNVELYHDFQKSGHTAYMKTFIGAGPKGETLIFGLTGEQKAMMSGIPHVDLYFGTTEAAGKFYGEMAAEGRIFVFSSLADMTSTRDTGEAALRFSDIGAGPNGETVIYVLNSENKKVRPDALMAQFKAINFQ